MAENWIDKMARILNKSPEYLRQLNFVKEGEMTHFGQVMESNQASLSQLLAFRNLPNGVL